MDNNDFPMIHADDASGLTFVWFRPTATNIEITREEVQFDGGSTFHADQSIGIYDHASGTIELEPTREAFEARVSEWIKDQG